MVHLKRPYLPFQVIVSEKHFTENFFNIDQLSTISSFHTIVDIRKKEKGCWYTFMNKSFVIATPKSKFGMLLKSSDQELLEKLEMRKKE